MRPRLFAVPGRAASLWNERARFADGAGVKNALGRTGVPFLQFRVREAKQTNARWEARWRPWVTPPGSSSSHWRSWPWPVRWRWSSVSPPASRKGRPVPNLRTAPVDRATFHRRRPRVHRRRLPPRPVPRRRTPPRRTHPPPTPPPPPPPPPTPPPRPPPRRTHPRRTHPRRTPPRRTHPRRARPPPARLRPVHSRPVEVCR